MSYPEKDKRVIFFTLLNKVCENYLYINVKKITKTATFFVTKSAGNSSVISKYKDIILSSTYLKTKFLLAT